MAQWQPDELRNKGATAAFNEALATIPSVWQNHCMNVPSTTNAETFVFPGYLPVPREFVDSRSFQGMRDFTFTLTNNTYELSLIINRTHWEDDQKALIRARISEAAEAWATFKDSLFATLLTNGNVSGNNGFDGTTFHTDTRTIGASANIDNNTTSAATTGTIPTAAELLAEMAIIKALMWRYEDDQGRPFNNGAISKLRLVVPPSYERACLEAFTSTLLGGGNDNPFGKNLAEFDVLPYLTGDTEMWVNAVGSSRLPFIYQERTPLEVIVLDDAASVAEADGVKLLTRQRFIFGYGEPRRSVLHTFS